MNYFFVLFSHISSHNWFQNQFKPKSIVKETYLFSAINSNQNNNTQEKIFYSKCWLSKSTKDRADLHRTWNHIVTWQTAWIYA